MRVFVEFSVDLRVPLMLEELSQSLSLSPRKVLMKSFSMHLQIISDAF